MSLSFNAPEVMDLLLKDIAGQFMMKIKKAADVPERMVKMLVALLAFSPVRGDIVWKEDFERGIHRARGYRADTY